MKGKKGFRVEVDSMGKVKIPRDAYWGSETQRAMENFPISGSGFPAGFIRILGLVKMVSAEVNMSLGLLDREIGSAIVRAAREVMEGKWNGHFVVDIFQTGSGTSTHMNANEVISNRAIEILGGEIGSKDPVHPHDHVNLGQSSNDVIPSCIHILAVEKIQQGLIPVLEKLRGELETRVVEFKSVIKLGRTHLQDALPVRLGQEFQGYASMIDHNLRRIKSNLPQLLELALGGTAVGTGINCHPEFPRKVIKRISEISGVQFREAENHFEAQGGRDAIVQTSATLKTLAVSLTKIANDFRWMGSGPRGGLGELEIPAVQPGSSMMPGKVNPVIAEAVLQVAAQVIGNDTVITLCGQSGNFELNTMMPVMALNLFQSIDLLTAAIGIFGEKLVKGLRPDKKRCQELMERSFAMVTVLTPEIGYDQAAEIAREAFYSKKSLLEIIRERHIISEDKIRAIFDPNLLTGPDG